MHFLETIKSLKLKINSNLSKLEINDFFSIKYIQFMWNSKTVYYIVGYNF